MPQREHDNFPVLAGVGGMAVSSAWGHVMIHMIVIIDAIVYSFYNSVTHGSIMHHRNHERMVM